MIGFVGVNIARLMGKNRGLFSLISLLFVVLLFTACPPPGGGGAGNTMKVPDTGQTAVYATGDDGSFTINPMSYTDNGNGTITDNVTTLMWQKQDDGTTRDWNAATSYCTGLPLGGHADWRVPSYMELIGIVNYGASAPAIYAAFFPQTASLAYWTSIPYASGSTTAWAVQFNIGNVANYGKTTTLHVRCVRGQQTSPSFTDNGNGTIADNLTGLMWQKQDAGANKNWADAITYCNELSLAGFTDWRLPNIKELASIVDTTAFMPAINAAYFTGTNIELFWASTTFGPNTTEAWLVRAWDGTVGANPNTDRSRVRCVRLSQDTSTKTDTSSRTDTGTGTTTTTRTDTNTGTGTVSKTDTGTGTGTTTTTTTKTDTGIGTFTRTVTGTGTATTTATGTFTAIHSPTLQVSKIAIIPTVLMTPTSFTSLTTGGVTTATVTAGPVGTTNDGIFTIANPFPGETLVGAHATLPSTTIVLASGPPALPMTSQSLAYFASLNYSDFGKWAITDATLPTNSVITYIAYGGGTQLTTTMPTSGSASYIGIMTGVLANTPIGGSDNVASYISLTVTFTPGGGTISGSMYGVQTQAGPSTITPYSGYALPANIPFNDITLSSGTITGNSFTATVTTPAITGATTMIMNGNFYGVSANEVAGTFTISVPSPGAGMTLIGSFGARP